MIVQQLKYFISLCWMHSHVNMADGEHSSAACSSQFGIAVVVFLTLSVLFYSVVDTVMSLFECSLTESERSRLKVS